MKREDIMEIAEKAAVVSAETVVSVIHDGDFALFGKSSIVKFATLIAAAEREECAKVCEAFSERAGDYGWSELFDQYCKGVADAIRARGKE